MSDIFAPDGGWRVRILDLSGASEDNIVEEDDFADEEEAEDREEREDGEGRGRNKRRRRRRGGRNRNRRDRDQVDSNTSENTGMDDSGAGMHADHIESNTVEVVQQFIEHAHEPHASHQADAPASIAESHTATPSWTSQPVETPTTAAVTPATVVEDQVTQVDSHAHEHHDHQNHHMDMQ